MTKDTFDLPDFEDLLALAKEVGETETALIKTKFSLEELLADITAKVTKTQRYWVSDKPPSMSYIENNYHKLGYNDETKEALRVAREGIAELTGNLTTAKNSFQVMRDMVSVWQTHQANQRATVI